MQHNEIAQRVGLTLMDLGSLVGIISRYSVLTRGRFLQPHRQPALE